MHPQLREEAESLMRVRESHASRRGLAKEEHVDMQTTRRPRGKPSPRRDALLPRMIAGWLERLSERVCSNDCRTRPVARAVASVAIKRANQQVGRWIRAA